MSTSYGFFNSLNGDRVYNADDVNTFLEGLITASGIYGNVDNMLQVTAGTGMSVNVGSGKAAIQHHWFRSTAAVPLSLSAAHQILNRYDVIVLRLDIVNRSIALGVLEGTPATTPTVPAIVRNDNYYDLKLAQVYIPAGATQVMQTNINDQRLNTAVCGIITGLIDQLDTSAFLSQLNAWMVQETAAFESWFDTLTEELNVNTYIEQYRKRVTGTSAAIKNIPLDMTGYVYDEHDVIFVTLNGLAMTEGAHYDIVVTNGAAKVSFRYTGSSSLTNEATIRVIKSKIGDIPQQGITRASIVQGADDITTTFAEISSDGTNDIGTTATIQEVE